MGDEEKASKRVCSACGQDVSPGEDVCPHCGNVFRKEEGDWEWKLISKKREPAKRQTENEIDRGNDD